MGGGENWRDIASPVVFLLPIVPCVLRLPLRGKRKTENEAPEKEEEGLRKYMEIGLGNLCVDIGA